MHTFNFEYNVELDEVIMISPQYIKDIRGEFIKNYEKNIFGEKDIHFEITEEYRLISNKGVLRGIHLQNPHSQKRLISVITGCIMLVVVDLRRDSDTVGKYGMYVLDDENRKVVYVPKGFGVGTLTLKNKTIIEIKCSGEYFGECAMGICYDDKDLAIPWPIDENEKIIISEKDKQLMSFKEFICRE